MESETEEIEIKFRLTADNQFSGHAYLEVWKRYAEVFYSLNRTRDRVRFKDKTHLRVGFSNIDNCSKLPAAKGLKG